MRLETNCRDRKALARAIGEKLCMPVCYDGVPSCSYSIGPVRVERDAAVTCEDADAWNALTPFFQSSGWMPLTVTDPEAIFGEEHIDPTDSEAMNWASAGRNANAVETDSAETEQITVNSVSLPADGFTVQSAANLLHLIYARQDLLNAMTRGDSIGVDDELITLLHEKQPESMDALRALLDLETAAGMAHGISFSDGRLTFDLPFDGAHPTDWQHYAKLMAALAEKAKTAMRVKAKRITPQEAEMKYFCNSLLNQLGFGGREHKEMRRVMLGHLSGYAAFKSSDGMEMHRAKYSGQRRGQQQEGETQNETDR